MLLHDDYFKQMEDISRDFNSRKAEYRKSMTTADLINAGVGFMLGHVDFNGLESVEEMGQYVAENIFAEMRNEKSRKGELRDNDGTTTD